MVKGIQNPEPHQNRHKRSGKPLISNAPPIQDQKNNLGGYGLSKLHISPLVYIIESLHTA